VEEIHRDLAEQETGDQKIVRNNIRGFLIQGNQRYCKNGNFRVNGNGETKRVLINVV